MTNKLSPNQALFWEIHTSIFFVLTVIHRCASFKKIFTADLDNQELGCLGPIWGEKDSFGEFTLIYVTFFVSTSGASSSGQIYKKSWEHI